MASLQRSSISGCSCQHTYTMQHKQHIDYIFAKLVLFGWSESIPTLYKTSLKHPYIDLWHLCKDPAYLAAPASIYTLCSIRSILIISLQSLCSLAGPRAFSHYLRPHRSIPTLIYCISAKLQTIQLLCGHPNTV